MIIYPFVAPLAGARIETCAHRRHRRLHQVAPLAGARIETDAHEMTSSVKSSLPSRERELKLLMKKQRKRDILVAPLAGARIETENSLRLALSKKSLPSRERELKPDIVEYSIAEFSRSPRGSAN